MSLLASFPDASNTSVAVAEVSWLSRMCLATSSSKRNSFGNKVVATSLLDQAPATMCGNDCVLTIAPLYCPCFTNLAWPLTRYPNVF